MIIYKRIKVIEDPEVKAELISDYTRYRRLHPRCSNQMLIYNLYKEARDEKDESLKHFVKATTELNTLKETERILASLITDDHIMADTMKKPVAAIFPNVQGFIIIIIITFIISLFIYY